MKNRLLTFGMVICMVGLLVGCSKLTKSIVKNSDVVYEENDLSEIIKGSDGKDLIQLSFTSVEFKENERTKNLINLVNEKNQTMKDYYHGEFLEICEPNLEYMPSDDFLFEAEVKFDVEMNSNDLVSMCIMDYDYAGGAHGSTSYVGMTYDLKSGNLVKLSDMFVTPDYKETLKDLVIKFVEDNKNDIDPFEEYKTYLDDNINDDEFYIDENGNLVLLFNQYDIAPYAAGPIFITIDNSDIENILTERFK